MSFTFRGTPCQLNSFSALRLSSSASRIAENFSNFDSASSLKDIEVNFNSCGRPGYELKR